MGEAHPPPPRLIASQLIASRLNASRFIAPLLIASLLSQLTTTSCGPHLLTLHRMRARDGAFGHAPHPFEQQRLSDIRACSRAPRASREVCFPPEASTSNRTAGTACELHASPSAAPLEAADPPCEERRLRRLVRQVAVLWCRLLHGLDACRWPGRTRKQGRDYTRARAEKPGPWGEEARARARRARRVHLGRQRTSEASRSHCSRIVQAAGS